MGSKRLLGHYPHYHEDADPDDDVLAVPTGSISCDCGWFDGPVLRIGAWKSRLLDLYRGHVESLQSAA